MRTLRTPRRTIKFTLISPAAPARVASKGDPGRATWRRPRRQSAAATRPRRGCARNVSDVGGGRTRSPADATKGKSYRPRIRAFSGPRGAAFPVPRLRAGCGAVGCRTSRPKHQTKPFFAGGAGGGMYVIEWVGQMFRLPRLPSTVPAAATVQIEP